MVGIFDEAASEGVSARRDPVVDRTVRLFEFLTRAQLLKSSPVLDAQKYDRVLWLADDVPGHPAASMPIALAANTSARGWSLASRWTKPSEPTVAPQPDDPLLTVERVPQADPPEPPQAVARWLDGPYSDATKQPGLLEEIPDLEQRSGTTALKKHPEVQEAYAGWLPNWQTWAEQDNHDRPARDLYNALFSISVNVAAHTEELELVAGVGCLAWARPGQEQVRRHLVTCPVTIHLDERSGQLTVRRVVATPPLAVEFDMLDPATVRPTMTAIKSELEELDVHPLDRAALEPQLQRLTNSLDSSAEYTAGDSAPAPSVVPRVAFAPALILRKRSGQGMADLFRTIIGQLSESNAVPSGLLPLVDPNHAPRSSGAGGSGSGGAAVDVDGEVFLPLPVNERQLKVITTVDSSAQTLVQGPPGTGKTHTAAALLSHLLAQGKRVLITAHTDRALKEVRQKLPEQIKPLAVAVVGSSREDMSDLRVAVERISATASDHDPEQAQATIAACVEQIEALRRERAAAYRQVVAIREHEVRVHDKNGFHGTLAAIAQRLAALAPQFEWAAEFVHAESSAPLSDADGLTWLAYLRDPELNAEEAASRQALVDLALAPSPADFAAFVSTERAARARDSDASKAHPAFAALTHLPRGEREGVRATVRSLRDQLHAWRRRPEPWAAAAVEAVATRAADAWRVRESTLRDLISQATGPVDNLGVTIRVTVTGGDSRHLEHLAHQLWQHLSATGTQIKLNSDGSAKIGALSGGHVKRARPLLESVRVNGTAPATIGHLGAFLNWTLALHTLEALDQAWPDGTTVIRDDTLSEWLHWHRNEHRLLEGLLRFGDTLDTEGGMLAARGLPVPHWADESALESYLGAIDAADSTEDLANASRAIAEVEGVLTGAAHQQDASPSVTELLAATESRDTTTYLSAHTRVTFLAEVRRRAQHRDTLAARLGASGLRQAVEANPVDPVWETRLRSLEKAWAWAATSLWLRAQAVGDINALQTKVGEIEAGIRAQVELLAATRAWDHAVSPDRLDGQARANLNQYAQLVRKLGKGTGKYAAAQRADIRRAMERCRPAVPVWIMPIYRIAEQLRISPDMFDVVLVDEASQAGTEAVFLQYLAPKIVIVGDDKQVSPSAVGVDQAKLRQLGSQYLFDDTYQASWIDPQRSLFDEAKMRYPNLITLVEHRRCMPEIIGFSNRVAYEPDGIRLVPVRQYGAERLDPVKAVYLPDGVATGTTSKVNRAEAEAIVDQLQQCLDDPAYDGKTFGVISLLGTAQARLIEHELLQRVPPETWAARDLRCGDSADFQGSERDVVFLSLVAAREPGKRLGAMTRDMYVQRFNVAASRAKDQMWLFHSLTVDEVANQEDMRFALLDYCYGVINRGTALDEVSATVPEDTRVAPFDSLFEQRVYNRLADRGFTVLPQHEVAPYRIDLVVVGAAARLAIECDGDTWHGPDRYEHDLRRQRELERNGWTFFRVRESAFYTERQKVLGELWKTLEGLRIRPSGQINVADDEPDMATAIENSAADEGGALARPVVEAEAAVAPELIAPGDTPPAQELLEVSTPVEAPAPPLDDMDSAVEVHPAAPTEQVVEPTTTANQPGLEEYTPFDGHTAPALSASRAAVFQGLRAITEAEGPLTGNRLRTAYVRASGGQKIGSIVGQTLDSCISAAVHNGILVPDNPLQQRDILQRTYRLPEQPEVRPRTLGPRSLDDVPPRELAWHITDIAQHYNQDEVEAIYREVLHRYGMKRLTPGVRARLDGAASISLEERK